VETDDVMQGLYCSAVENAISSSATNTTSER